MLGLIISVILFIFIVWGIPLFFLKKPHNTAQSVQGFCNTHLVITAKNAEDSIEGMVRSIAWQISNQSNNSCLLTDVFILDLESSDQTFAISERLAREYAFIHPMSTEDYIAYIRTLAI